MIANKDPALEGLFDSNVSPSSQQHSVAQAAIESFDQVLSAVDKHIADLESQLGAANQPLVETERQLKEFQAEKKAIEEKKRKYLDVVSARRRIPTEIVGGFVEWACPDPTTSFDGNPPFLPFLLVSRGWYRAVYSTCSLWTGLHLDLRLASEERIQCIVDKATRWYSRAGSLPLTLSLSLSSSNPNNHIFIDYLHSIANGLGTLEMRVEMATSPDNALLRRLFRDPDSKHIPWPQTKKLHLNIRSKGDIEREIQLQDVFTHPRKQFPVLEVFTIRCNKIISKFDMPWDALTTLRLGPFGVARGRGMTYCSILGSCPSLRSLHIGIEARAGFDTRHFIRNPRQPAVDITLPHLTELSVEHGFICENACEMLLGRLILPSLRSFSFRYTGPPSTGVFSLVPVALTELVIRSGNSSTIQSISLGLDEGLNGSIAFEELDRLLQEVPVLETLELAGDEIDIGLMDILPKGLNALTLQLAVDTAKMEFQRYITENPSQRVRVRIRESSQAEVVGLPLPVLEDLFVSIN